MNRRCFLAIALATMATSTGLACTRIEPTQPKPPTWCPPDPETLTWWSEHDHKLVATYSQAERALLDLHARRHTKLMLEECERAFTRMLSGAPPDKIIARSHANGRVHA